MLILIAALAFSILSSAVGAQLRQPAISPIVHRDKSVTFALHAPHADSVHVKRHPGQTLLAMRDSTGIWRATSNPLAPGVHFYSFSVDGLLISDPQNPFVHASLFPIASGVIVPGDQPTFCEEQEVPRGRIHLHRHTSTTYGDLRGYAVYTPPGYYEDTEKQYPTLYLLHGYSDHEGTWSNSGRAGVIMDNLLARDVAVPMLVVMPYGYVPPTDGDSDGDWGDWFSKVSSRLEPYIVNELRQRIESEYRVRNSSSSRAIAGLSMGGGQSLLFGLKNTDVYSWIGAFSSAIELPLFEPYLAQAGKINKDVALLWVGCGTEDFLFERNNEFLKTLHDNDITHIAYVSEGAHAWPVWHHYLRAFAVHLFK